jgi:hypothetical protein
MFFIVTSQSKITTVYPILDKEGKSEEDKKVPNFLLEDMEKSMAIDVWLWFTGD